MTDTAMKLMDAAEARMREAGYHGFSFREIGLDVGISSASVHYHFPTKAGMVAAIMRRHNERFAQMVVAKPGETEQDAIDAYRSAFREALCSKGGMCLAGMLGAKSGGLPSDLNGEVEQFFRDCVDDLAGRIHGPDAKDRAFAILAALEGGLILAQVYKNVGVFDRATEDMTVPAH